MSILIAEDNMAQRHYLREILEQEFPSHVPVFEAGAPLALATTGPTTIAAPSAVLNPRVLSVMGIVSVGFLLFMLLTSNPFARLSPVPFDGRDLNPLLQDPAMVAHPPMLYMGYVGFSVAFAFAIAALIGG